MRPINFFSISLLLLPGVLLAEVEFSEQELNKLLRVKIMTARHIGVNPSIVTPVNKQNNKNMSLSEIKDIDDKWKSSKKLTPFKLSLQQNQAGLYLRSIVEKNKDINEAFLTDAKGANVAAYPATSDYWQGDEKKWSNSFNNGSGKVFIGPVEIDESTNKAAVQISAPVVDHLNGAQTVGVIIVGVTLDYLESK